MRQTGGLSPGCGPGNNKQSPGTSRRRLSERDDRPTATKRAGGVWETNAFLWEGSKPEKTARASGLRNATKGGASFRKKICQPGGGKRPKKGAHSGQGRCPARAGPGIQTGEGEEEGAKKKASIPERVGRKKDGGDDGRETPPSPGEVSNINEENGKTRHPGGPRNSKKKENGHPDPAGSLEGREREPLGRSCFQKNTKPKKNHVAPKGRKREGREHNKKTCNGKIPLPN